MGKIHVLGFEIANLIAAGEVVDRPSSVLKELLENAIDAGGRRITAEISRGGVRSIRVTDDGCGMTAEDLPVAIRRHATSKIQAASDLDSIATLGFRGEALAAISAVSDVTIITKVADAAAGTMLTAECGTVTDLSEVGAADGTTVLVENLFARVPARRKFLKKDASEALSCAAVMERVAMSHPEIAFRFVSDGETRFATSGDGDTRNVLYAIYGKQFASRLLPVEGGNGSVGVTGFVGNSENSYGNRNMQNVFINGRYIKSKTVTAALERAFTSYMAPERFPVAVLYLTVNPRNVDVNVHPAKLEVRFSDERVVFESVYYAVRAALEANTERPDMELKNRLDREEKARQYTQAFQPIGTRKPEQVRLGQPVGTTSVASVDDARRAGSAAPAAPALRASASAQGAAAPGRAPDMSPAESLAFLAELSAAARAAQADAHAAPIPGGKSPAGRNPQPASAPIETGTGASACPSESGAAAAPTPLPSYRFVGQAFRTYLFVEVEDALLIIDQHAAHERLIFEDLLARQRADGRLATQALLLPLTVPLTPEERAAVLDARGELESVGFTFLDAEGGVSLSAVPNAVSPSDAGELFAAMAGELADGTGNPARTDAVRRERALYQIACKAAIKGGRTYEPAQLDWLIRQVLSMPDVTVCPHGRPIAYRLTKGELDRRFDRIK